MLDSLQAIADELKAQKKQLLAYMDSKLKSCDMHAVADAAMDVREIDAKLDVLAEVSGDA